MTTQSRYLQLLYYGNNLHALRLRVCLSLHHPLLPATHLTLDEALRSSTLYWFFIRRERRRGTVVLRHHARRSRPRRNAQTKMQSIVVSKTEANIREADGIRKMSATA